MKKFLEAASTKALSLPPVYFYSALVLICIGLMCWSWIDEPTKEESVKQESIAGLTESLPHPVTTSVSLKESLPRDLGQDVELAEKLKQALRSLEKQVAIHLENGSARTPEWILPEFKATGISREQFTLKHSDSQIIVKRWRKPENPPKLSGADAFAQFVSNTMKPWASASNFRVNLKSFQTESDKEDIVAHIVGESFGHLENKAGIQATSIWKTRWRRGPSGLNLCSIEVQAQEESAIKNPNGQLLLDYTASILEGCDCWSQQIAFGLDQWARRIPHLDVVGNQGVAVGDINNDGMDDIYLCQPHGLPNRLLIQNADGTVHDFSHESKLDVLDQSHAALMIDIDNDSDQDLVVSTDENLLLFSNKGDGQFQLEHQMSIGRNAQSLIAADYDQDGDLDLFLCKFQDINRQHDALMFPVEIDGTDDGGRNVLLRNDEGWKFVDATEQAGITNENSFYSRSAAWVDFDLDGDSDLYITNEFRTDQLLENQDGWFDDISEKAGLTHAARNRSVSIGEFNQDGVPDLFVATDMPLSAFRQLKEANKSPSAHPFQKMMLGESRVWFGDQANRVFKPFFLKAPIFATESAFGSVTTDLNNDGFEDVLVTNGFLSRYLDDEADELFLASAFSGSSEQSTSAQTVSSEKLAANLTHSAHNVSDLIRSGQSFSGRQRNRCFLGMGRLGFANFSSLSGIDLQDDGRAIAVTDWDSDGDPDVVITNRTGPQLRILCNQSNASGSFLHFDLVGTESNRDAIGARVEVQLKGRKAPLLRTVLAGSGNLSQSTKRIMFGLPDGASVEEVRVVWPTKKVQTFAKLLPNTRYEIIEGSPNAAEKTNQRFNLAIKPRNIDGSTELPPVQKQASMYPRSPLPNLQLETEPDKWFTLSPKEDQTTLAVFCSCSSLSESALSNLTDHNELIQEAGIRPIAIFADEKLISSSEKHQQAQTFMDTAKAVMPWGIAPKSTIEKLKVLSGDWFYNGQLPQLPFAILIDQNGDACKFYSAEAFNSRQIIRDAAAIDSPIWQYRLTAAPLGGRWIADHRMAKLNRLRTQFKKLGYTEDVALLEKRSQPQRAFEICQKAIEYGSKGETDRAMKLFGQAIQIDPTCVAAYVGEGNLLRKLASETKLDNEESRVEMRQRAAIDFESAIELDPMNTEAIIGRANVAIEQNQISEALLQLTGYLKVAPDHYEIHAIVGRLLFHEKKYREAAGFLIAAYERRPSLPFVAGDLGYLYLISGDHKEAKKYLSYANRLQPSDRNIVRLLAEAEFATGNYEMAIELFDQVATADPNRRRARKVLAWLLATCPYEANRDGAKAIKLMDPLVDLLGDSSAMTLEICAASFAETKQFDKAIEFQQKACDLVDKQVATDGYTDLQKSGMRSRLELYQRKQPYRTSDIAQIPLVAPGVVR